MAATASLRTVSDDVWGSFASGVTFSNRVPTLNLTGGSADSGSDPTVAAGLVAVGTLGLLSGLAVAAVSRRRRSLAIAESVSATQR